MELWPVERPLTWDDVVAQAEVYLRHLWTRQGLERHARIKEAYEAKRDAHRQHRRTGKVPKKRLPEDELRVQQIARLTGELEAASEQIRAVLTYRFVRAAAAARAAPRPDLGQLEAAAPC